MDPLKLQKHLQGIVQFNKSYYIKNERIFIT